MVIFRVLIEALLRIGDEIWIAYNIAKEDTRLEADCSPDLERCW